MKKMPKNEIERKMRQMVKIMEAALKDIDTFMGFGFDETECDKELYHEALRAEGRLFTVLEYLKRRG